MTSRSLFRAFRSSRRWPRVDPRSGESILDRLPILTTERLVLRALRHDDAATLHPAFADAATMRWWSSGPHADVAETRVYIVDNVDDDAYLTWAIAARDGDDAAIGWGVLMPRRSGVAELGYILRPTSWGQGFAREAVGAIIAHGFGALELRRIFADTDPDNRGSIGLLEALGFVCEGRLRGEWVTHIGVRDSLIWGLLAEEWSARRN